jgi:hypothetical protein
MQTLHNVKANQLSAPASQIWNLCRMHWLGWHRLAPMAGRIWWTTMAGWLWLLRTESILKLQLQSHPHCFTAFHSLHRLKPSAHSSFCGISCHIQMHLAQVTQSFERHDFRCIQLQSNRSHSVWTITMFTDAYPITFVVHWMWQIHLLAAVAVTLVITLSWCLRCCVLSALPLFWNVCKI